MNQFYFDLVDQALPESVRKDNARMANVSYQKEDDIGGDNYQELSTQPQTIPSSNGSTTTLSLTSAKNNKKNIINSSSLLLSSCINNDFCFSEKPECEANGSLSRVNVSHPNSLPSMCLLEDDSVLEKEQYQQIITKLRTEVQVLQGKEVDLKQKISNGKEHESILEKDLLKANTNNDILKGKLTVLNKQIIEEGKRYSKLEKQYFDEKNSKSCVESKLEKTKLRRKEETDQLRGEVEKLTQTLSQKKNECQSEGCKVKQREASLEISKLKEDLLVRDAETNQYQQLLHEKNRLQIECEGLREQLKHSNESLRQENKFKQEMLTAYYQAKEIGDNRSAHISSLEMDLNQTQKERDHYLLLWQKYCKFNVPPPQSTSSNMMFGSVPSTSTNEAPNPRSPINGTSNFHL